MPIPAAIHVTIARYKKNHNKVKQNKIETIKKTKKLDETNHTVRDTKNKICQLLNQSDTVSKRELRTNSPADGGR